MAADDVRVRPATAGDAASVARIGRIAFPAAHEGLIPGELIDAVVEQTYAVDALEQCIEMCAADDSAHFLVAERDAQVVGYLHYDTTGAEPELHRIYVAPDIIGAGVGSALLHDLHRRLGPGVSYILMVAAGNERAVRFYERHGFRVDRTVDGLAFYREHMDVDIPHDVEPVPAVVLRNTT